MTNSSYATIAARLKTRIQRSRHYSDYGVHTSRITPLNPPIYWGEMRFPVPSPTHRGGLGWGKTDAKNQVSKLFQTCVYTVAINWGGSQKPPF